MALTKISTDGVKDDAITKAKIPADQIEASELANNAVDTNAIQDDAVTEDKLANSINTAIAANTAKTSNATHTGDVTGSTSLTIADNAVSISKIGCEQTTITDSDSHIPTSGAVVDYVADNTSGKNIIINGSMRVAQRATSTTMSDSGNDFPACDRFSYNRHGVTATVAQVEDAPAGKGFKYSLKWTSTSAVSSIAAGNTVKFLYKVETQDIKRLGYGSSNGKTATLSFWAKGSLAGKIGISFRRDSRITSHNVDMTENTWEYHEVVIPVDTSTGFSAADTASGFDIGICWGAGANSTSGAVTSWTNFHNAYTAGFTAGQQGAYLTTQGSTFQITGVQLEIGNKATAFEHLPYADELLRCQRYYENVKGSSYNSSQEVLVANGFAYTTSRVIGNFQFKAEKRVKPSTSTDDPSEVQVLKTNAAWYSSGSFGGNSNRYCTRLDCTSISTSPLTEGHGSEIRLVNDGIIHFDAEL